MPSYFRFVWKNKLFQYLLYLNLLINCFSFLPEAPIPESSKSQISQLVCGQPQISNSENQRSHIISVFLFFGAINPQSETHIQGYLETSLNKLENLNGIPLVFLYKNIAVKLFFQFPSSSRAPPIKV